MTLFWIKRPRAIHGIIEKTNDDGSEPEYDEEGRRYVFRYPKAPQPRYCMDRSRVFTYLAKHDLPDIRDRSIRRDMRNAANFYEDVRDLQTHPDVMVAYEQASEVARLRLRSAS